MENMSDKATPLIDDSMYNSVFQESYSQTMFSIMNDPIHNIFGPSPISEIAACCIDNEEFKTRIKHMFSLITSKPLNITLVDDREKLFCELHKVRLSSEVADICKILESSKCPHPEKSNMFVQVFLLEFINKLLHNYGEKIKTESHVEEKAISEMDQSVLFYISGFILHSLLKKYLKMNPSPIKHQKVNMIKELQCKQNNSTSLNKIAAWVEKQNRGSLKRPSDNFFYLVRAMESIVRKTTGPTISATSLNKCILLEKMHENYMVKFYSEKLFVKVADDISDNEEDESDDSSTVASTLEEIMNLFLTVRGFAVTRLKRKTLAKQNQQKKGSSFREALKAKCTNL